MAVLTQTPEIVMDDFSGGMVRRGSRETIPRNGAYDLTNVLLQADGKPFRRAGSAYKSNASLDSTALNFLWDGSFNAGQRTVFAANSKVAVLDSNDASPITLWSGLGMGATPNAGVRVGNWLLAPLPITGSADVWVYAGSRKAASYGAGTVAINTGSRVLTGSGTNWSANVDAGMIVAVANASKRFTVASVDSNTQIVLDDIWIDPTTSGQVYNINPSERLTPSNTLVSPNRPKLANIANRVAYTAGNFVGLSDINNPYKYTSGNYLRFSGLPVALTSVRETLMVFTTAGMYAIGGLANATPSDPAGNALWSYQLANAELIAWSHEGIGSWGGRAIVPCLDGIWMVDPTSGPRRISDNIRDLYLSYVAAGYVSGVAAVHNNHYFLPVLNGTTWVDTLTCKLDTTAWTHFAGSGAKVNCFAARKSNPPFLLGGDTTTGSRVFKLDYFNPATALKADHDGTAHQPSITTGDLAPTEQPSRFKRLRVWQEGTVDSGSPTLAVTAQRPSDGSAQTLSGGSSDATTQSALSDGSSYSWWSKNGSGGQGAFRGNRIRYTLTVTGALSSWVLHKLAVAFQPTGRQ